MIYKLVFSILYEKALMHRELTKLVCMHNFQLFSYFTVLNQLCKTWCDLLLPRPQAPPTQAAPSFLMLHEKSVRAYMYYQKFVTYVMAT